MINVVGVRFQQDGKMITYNALELTPRAGDYVIAETPHGIDLGEVVSGLRTVEDDQVHTDLPQLVRIATQQDVQRATDNRAREQEAYHVCQQKIAEHHLEMKLVSVESSFDNGKMLFYFTANGRVDFRALVRDLASTFRTRIELRQIGVRDEARMLGGLGACGRPLCCGAFLNDFQPVSIKMAKEQNLSLNPTKISGVCGRLMCCLKYEQDQYEQTRKRMPRVGREVITPDGRGTVCDLNVVKETVSVRLPSGDSTEIKVYPLEQITRPGQEGAAAPHPASDQENAGGEPGVDLPEEAEAAEAAELTEAEGASDSAEPQARPAGRNPRKNAAARPEKAPEDDLPTEEEEEEYEALARAAMGSRGKRPSDGRRRSGSSKSSRGKKAPKNPSRSAAQPGSSESAEKPSRPPRGKSESGENPSRPPRGRSEAAENASRPPRMKSDAAEAASRPAREKPARDPKLGQPVRRENPDRDRRNASGPQDSAAQAPSSASAPARNASPAPAASSRASRSKGWADALEKALQAAEK